MSWKRVRLEVARSRDFPEGSHRHGYEFTLPLDDDGKFDVAAYKKMPELCTVQRFWEGEGDTTGEILHSGRGRWVFSYDPGEGDDEAIPHLTDHHFKVGEYIAVRESGGLEHTLRIVLVEARPL